MPALYWLVVSSSERREAGDRDELVGDVRTRTGHVRFGMSGHVRREPAMSGFVRLMSGNVLMSGLVLRRFVGQREGVEARAGDGAPSRAASGRP